MKPKKIIKHASDCAVNNGPALKPGPCNCGTTRPKKMKPATVRVTEAHVMATHRIDNDENGDLDDIAIDGVSAFRMEKMNNGTWWVRVYCEDGRDEVFWLNAVGKGKMHASHHAEHDINRARRVRVTEAP